MADKLKRLTGSTSLKTYFESDYLGAECIDDGYEPILTIDSFWHGEVTLQKGKENKTVVRFKEKNAPGILGMVKPMILNTTNRKTLKKLYGSDAVEALEGKPIQLYVDGKVRNPDGGGFTEGLRIKSHKPRETKPVVTIKCESCDSILTAFGRMNPEQLAQYTQDKYSQVLCANCAKAAAEANETAESDEIKEDKPDADADEQTVID